MVLLEGSKYVRAHFCWLKELLGSFCQPRNCEKPQRAYLTLLSLHKVLLWEVSLRIHHDITHWVPHVFPQVRVEVSHQTSIKAVLLPVNTASVPFYAVYTLLVLMSTGITF